MPQFSTSEAYDKWKEKETPASQTPLRDANPTDTSGEKVIWQGKPEWRGYIIPLLFFGFVTVLGIVDLLLSQNLFIFIFGLALLAFAIYHRIQYDFKVTDKRIITTKGIIGKRTGEVDIRDIRSINVTQGALQRMLKIGHIQFTTASGPIKEVAFIHIKDPEQLKELIRKYK